MGGNKVSLRQKGHKLVSKGNAQWTRVETRSTGGAGVVSPWPRRNSMFNCGNVRRIGSVVSYIELMDACVTREKRK